MKNKIIYLIAGVLLASFTAFAQEDTGSDKDSVDFDALKPKAGDFGIGISAIPYLNYLGNFFGKTNTNALSLTSQTLYGKYFLTDASAIRVAVSVANSKETTNNYSQDDAAIALDPTSTAQVIDTQIYTERDMGFTVGYEMRKDSKRFAFLYGASLGYEISSSRTEYTYGNPISALNPEPTDAFGVGTGTARTLVVDGGITHIFSGGIFAGVEYFIASQFAVGADFSLGYSYTMGTQEDASFEAWDGTQVYVFDRPISPGDSGYDLVTNQYSSPLAAGAIYVHFYF